MKPKFSAFKEKKELTLNMLQVTSDIARGAVLLSVNGRQEVYIENYRGIMDYTDQLIRVQAKHSRVVVLGHRLKIAYYTADEMKIVGWIEDISERISAGSADRIRAGAFFEYVPASSDCGVGAYLWRRRL